jgi:hypothetical protein
MRKGRDRNGDSSADGSKEQSNNSAKRNSKAGTTNDGSGSGSGAASRPKDERDRSYQQSSSSRMREGSFGSHIGAPPVVPPVLPNKRNSHFASCAGVGNSRSGTGSDDNSADVFGNVAEKVFPSSSALPNHGGGIGIGMSK